MARQIDKWHMTGPISTQRVALVEHCETGEQGFRAVAWNNGRPHLYGPVYSGPSCMSAAACREVGIPESEGERILCDA